MCDVKDLFSGRICPKDFSLRFLELLYKILRLGDTPEDLSSALDAQVKRRLEQIGSRSTSDAPVARPNSATYVPYATIRDLDAVYREREAALIVESEEHPRKSRGQRKPRGRKRQCDGNLQASPKKRRQQPLRAVKVVVPSADGASTLRPQSQVDTGSVRGVNGSSVLLSTEKSGDRDGQEEEDDDENDENDDKSEDENDDDEESALDSSEYGSFAPMASGSERPPPPPVPHDRIEQIIKECLKEFGQDDGLRQTADVFAVPAGLWPYQTVLTFIDAELKRYADAYTPSKKGAAGEEWMAAVDLSLLQQMLRQDPLLYLCLVHLTGKWYVRALPTALRHRSPARLGGRPRYRGHDLRAVVAAPPAENAPDRVQATLFLDEHRTDLSAHVPCEPGGTSPFRRWAEHALSVEDGTGPAQDPTFVPEENHELGPVEPWPTTPYGFRLTLPSAFEVTNEDPPSPSPYLLNLHFICSPEVGTHNEDIDEDGLVGNAAHAFGVSSRVDHFTGARTPAHLAKTEAGLERVPGRRLFLRLRCPWALGEAMLGVGLYQDPEVDRDRERLTDEDVPKAVQYIKTIRSSLIDRYRCRLRDACGLTDDGVRVE